jgi:hypothetical protein
MEKENTIVSNENVNEAAERVKAGSFGCLVFFFVFFFYFFLSP